MNSVHDMGGMDGFGPVVFEQNEPVFHEPWEARVFGIALSARGISGWTLDTSRHSREVMPPALYLSLSYYQRWLVGREAALLSADMVRLEELQAGQASRPPDGDKPPTPPDGDKSPTPPDKLLAGLAKGYNAERQVDAAPRFAVGDAVVTRNIHPAGHTRLPRYARDKAGRIHARRGAFVLPDSNAHGRGESPEHLYCVEIAARALWGEAAAARDKVYLDLWESYLRAA